MTVGDLIQPAKQFIKNVNKALRGKKVYEPRLNDYMLCKHMHISKQTLDDMYEEDVQAWRWIMKRELKHNSKQ